jgi:CRISPR/Cas system CMR-associated protein Cmr5 small subunit
VLGKRGATARFKDIASFFESKKQETDDVDSDYSSSNECSFLKDHNKKIRHAKSSLGEQEIN